MINHSYLFMLTRRIESGFVGASQQEERLRIAFGSGINPLFSLGGLQ
jgi:hypothetical protein